MNVWVQMFDAIRQLDQWIDDANAGQPHDWQDAMRLFKLAEELGEVTTAYFGFTGQNPRKGVCDTEEHVRKELLDVALTALCAHMHFTKSQTQTMAEFHQHVMAVRKRAFRGVESVPGVHH